jgi:hypothetical protein
MFGLFEDAGIDVAEETVDEIGVAAVLTVDVVFDEGEEAVGTLGPMEGELTGFTVGEDAGALPTPEPAVGMVGLVGDGL